MSNFKVQPEEMNAVSREQNSADTATHSIATLTRGVTGALLFVATVTAYLPALSNDFVSYDDGVYVTDNPATQLGLSVQSVGWAFSNKHSGTWQPITWLSHMADCEVYGLAPWGHHLTSILLHALASVILYGTLARLTREHLKSLFVAGVFALHPLHVESVAWVAERKDVLSACFGFLALWAYGGYAREPGRRRYGGVFLFLVIGLMAKPTLVTFPFVMLLLDYWPLGRFKTGWSAESRRAVLEKVPLLALTLIFSLTTLITQQAAQAISPLAGLSLRMRVSNAVVAYLRYMEKTLWPSGLAVYYPHPRDTLGMGELGFAALLLLAVTVAAILLRRRSPYFAVGWFWYVGTLVPVIGLVQVGTQGMADRYMYLPIVGLAIVVSWGVPQAVGFFTGRLRLRTRERAAAGLRVAAISLLLVFAWRTWVQTGVWRDSEALFRRALAVTDDNEIAERALSKALIGRERYAEALPHLERALQLNPSNAETLYHVGLVHQRLGKRDTAITYYRQALDADPGYSRAHNNLGVTLMEQGRFAEASKAFEQALRTDPSNVEAAGNYGGALVSLGQYRDAETHLRDALQGFPQNASLHNNLGAALAGQGRIEEAKAEFQTALRLRPDYPEPQRALEALNKGE